MGQITLEKVTKSFGDVEVIPPLDLTIQDGEFTVFVGPSGCGKSTLLRLIAGLEDISGGTISIDGQDATSIPPAKRGLAMVFQSYALYPHMSVRKNIAFPMRMAGLPKDEQDRRIAQAAEALNLTDYLDRRPGQLSGGQRQRVAIGRAIVREPSAFLFDEPLSNLDAALRVGMRLEISELHKRLATTMIYVTHDQVEAMTMADRIVVLRAGHIEQVGSPLELYRSPRNTFVAGFIGSPRMNFIEGAAAQALGAHTIGIRPEHIDVAAQDAPWQGTVGVAEHLGSDTFFHVHGTGLAETLTVRAPGEVSFRHGDRIGLAPRTQEFHRFDAEGLRIA
ncbi:sugar ABC transporter ATP-binding protein [Brevirhabdus pacifica]|uniref:Sugar ABC transporter ATP-binding protein n=1 Tax=Brevirhabdus pacifica TaxID=1267768 RepID=A0A1U7DJ37_9RHOB|nr:ABC transporter ATP-binding protein [Brevirhabdus pacifica]APX89919.1 sugar ABC transporter ATP-binding protein [Brevirhabdus pacifica]OWU74355.1 glycerol-3-phosphate ABC transporter ATPase [Loktanella sp. 22II-4b]PJJ82853.1 sorbitol ABC transporter ATP-binding protein /mannitol ABC transporter ATP-binding protein [Brevirhabdus pacifica]